jgi:hypothetical protein
MILRANLGLTANNLATKKSIRFPKSAADSSAIEAAEKERVEMMQQLRVMYPHRAEKELADALESSSYLFEHAVGKLDAHEQQTPQAATNSGFDMHSIDEQLRRNAKYRRK